MKLVIHKFIFLFSLSTLFTAQSTAQRAYVNSICEMNYIQDFYEKFYSPTCITSSVKTGGEAGYTKVEEHTEAAVDYSPSGVPYLVPGRKIRKEVNVPSTYYSYRVFTNTCNTQVRVRAIRKTLLNTGDLLFEDASFMMDPGESKKLNIKYLDNYDRDAEIGSVIAYKNPLIFDSGVYNEYINSVVNSDKGTLIITPTSHQTRIVLYRGDKMIIRAGGSIKLGMFAGYSGPNGIEGFSGYSKTPNAKHGALIYGYPGSSFRWNFLGSNATLTVTDREWATLCLGVNDNSTDDDEGHYIVSYEIIRAK